MVAMTRGQKALAVQEAWEIPKCTDCGLDLKDAYTLCWRNVVTRKNYCTNCGLSYCTPSTMGQSFIDGWWVLLYGNYMTIVHTFDMQIASRTVNMHRDYEIIELPDDQG